MKVYIVGHHGPEHNMITSVHKTRKGAIKKWNELRLYLLRNAKRNMKKRTPDDMLHEMECATNASTKCIFLKTRKVSQN